MPGAVQPIHAVDFNDMRAAADDHLFHCQSESRGDHPSDTLEIPGHAGHLHSCLLQYLYHRTILPTSDFEHQ